MKYILLLIGLFLSGCASTKVGPTISNSENNINLASGEDKSKKETVTKPIYELPKKLVILPSQRFHPYDKEAVILLTEALLGKGYEILERINIDEVNAQQEISDYSNKGRTKLDQFLKGQNVNAVVIIASGVLNSITIRAVEIGTGRVLWVTSRNFSDDPIHHTYLCKLVINDICKMIKDSPTS